MAVSELSRVTSKRWSPNYLLRTCESLTMRQVTSQTRTKHYQLQEFSRSRKLNLITMRWYARTLPVWWMQFQKKSKLIGETYIWGKTTKTHTTPLTKNTKALFLLGRKVREEVYIRYLHSHKVLCKRTFSRKQLTCQH